MKSALRYQSALANIAHEEVMVDISEANGMEGTFRCPYCKGEMIKRCGHRNLQKYILFPSHKQLVDFYTPCLYDPVSFSELYNECELKSYKLRRGIFVNMVNLLFAN